MGSPDSRPSMPFDLKTVKVKRFFVPTHGANTPNGFVPIDRRIDNFVVAQREKGDVVQVEKLDLERGVQIDLITGLESNIDPDDWLPIPNTVFLDPDSNGGFSINENERGRWKPVEFTDLRELPNE